jgi:hypothetical protein
VNVITNILPNHGTTGERVSVTSVIPSELNRAIETWKQSSNKKQEKKATCRAKTARHRNLQSPGTYRNQVDDKGKYSRGNCRPRLSKDQEDKTEKPARPTEGSPAPFYVGSRHRRKQKKSAFNALSVWVQAPRETIAGCEGPKGSEEHLRENANQ